MHFSFYSNDPKFSYYLCKHPDTIIEKEINGRKIKSGFAEKSIFQYDITLTENILDFLKLAKSKNLDCYLNKELYSVCPYNIKALEEILRSLLRGKNCNPNEVTDEEFNSAQHLTAIFGPFSEDFDYVKDVFSDYGITVSKNSLYAHESIKNCYILNLHTSKKMSHTEFLQKIYILSIYITFNRQSIFEIDENVIDKVVFLTHSWLFENEERSRRIIAKFCYKNKNLKEKFQEQFNVKVLEDIVDSDATGISETSAFTVNQKIKALSLHEKRHNLLMKIIKEKNIEINSVVDLCTSEGKIIEKIIKEFPNASVLGLEKMHHKVKKLQQANSNNPKVRVIETNIILPNISESDLMPDLVTCIEAIEHFNKFNRMKLLELIKEILVPKYLYLTTPNVEYNKFYGMPDDTYRRGDHIIEYTTAQFKAEVIDYLSDTYDVEILEILDKNEDIEDSCYIEPSFCILATHKSCVEREMITLSKKFPDESTKRAGETFSITIPKDHWTPEEIEEWNTSSDYRKIRFGQQSRKVNYKALRKLKEYHGEIFLPVTGYTIREKELNAGYTSNAFITNSENIFCFGPSIAPVEYMTEPNHLPETLKIKNFVKNYIEHPYSAFKYYRERGIRHLIEEKKYMGSRGYILAFKTPEIADQYGFNQKVIVNSRKGFPFFEDYSILEQIWTDIFANPKSMDDPDYTEFVRANDYIMLDVEILPWAYKAESLIQEKFLAPVECSFLTNLITGRETESRLDVIKTLNNFIQDTPVKIHIFHMLLAGNVSNKSEINAHCLTHQEQLGYVLRICENSDIFSPCEYKLVDLEDLVSMESSLIRWLNYCGDSGELEFYNKMFENGISAKPGYSGGEGEGFVYKPHAMETTSLGGYFIQPALKVRGRKYLQLIYGIDLYSNEEYFSKITNRTIGNKRKMAIQQFELNKLIISAFSHKNKIQRMKHIAGFIGMENVNHGIDKTL